MTTYRMPALTAEEIRSIGEKAVADVARQRITTTKVGKSGAHKPRRHAHRHAKGGKAVIYLATKVLASTSASEVQKALAGSVLSQSEGRDFFKEAFNKARKG
ncbi:hypothetical protein C1Y41_18935 [Pantoea sp. ICBG 1758]|uniref:hypothetical protein n=1 Tax=Pantoea sp. ICBG 1758 TaxID=2071682 RepID=UPI000CE51EC9|nr:hypothetical protein [Pantoea sp. ICBG 1758]PPC61306.1 hypothetical protein C1Y41_18935 [Pantoea sp. ICBG 1758]